MKSKIYKLFSSAKHGLFVLVFTIFSGAAYSQTTYTFNYIGSAQTVTLATGLWGIQCWGANGGSITTLGGEGIGGYSQGQVNIVSFGTLLSIFVGGKGNPATGNTASAGAGGWNGGGGGAAVGRSGGGGGGASDVRSGGIASTNRIIVAGGGGGAAFYGSTLLTSSVAPGGNGGAQTGQNGSSISSAGVITIGGGGAGAVGATPGTAAVLTASGTATGGGGGGISAGSSIGQPGIGGGAGGAAGPSSSGSTGSAGGGGGGYAGGAGGVQTVNGGFAGGGGSAYLGSLINAATTMTGQPGFVPNPVVTGDGLVIITQLCNINLTNASTTGPGPICLGNSATITTNAIASYSWSNGGTSSSIVVSPSVTTSYTLTAASASNCIASAVITVTVDITPTVTAVISPSVICLNKTLVMTAVGANTYTWTGGATNGAPFTPTATGNYTYTVTGTNACGNSSVAVAATVIPAPTITGSVNNPTVCSGNNIVLNGFGSAGGYTWSAGAPNNSPFIPPASANYVVTGVGSNGCTNTAIVGVTVLITPTITPVVTPTAICLGGTATLSAAGATGYTWTPGTNPFTSTIAVSPPVPTTYTVTRTNGVCISNSTVNLIVYPLPLVNASATPSQICAGTGINLVVVGPISNTWLPGGFTIANFTVYPNFSTTYTVIGSNGNCTLSAMVPIVVNPSPTISISSSTNEICEGNSVTVTGSGALTYTWLPMNTNNNSEVVSPPTTTIITLNGSNSFGCTASVNQLILVNPIPDMSLASTFPFICVGQNAVLSIVNPSNMVVYNWSTGASGISISPNPIVTTSYFVTGTNTITGCTNSNSYTLSVYIATFVVTSPTAICKGQTATLTANGPATTYFWNANGGVTSPSVTVSPVITTTYNVIGTTGSCTSSTNVPVIVNPIPNVTAAAAKGQICRFEVSTITGNGATSYSWNTGATTQTISFTLSLTTTYTVTGTDVNGCSKTTTVSQFVATCIGIEGFSVNGDLGLNVYPNPNNGNFVVSSDVNINLSVINTLGQVVGTIKLSEDNKKEVTVSSLPNGIYFISGQSGNVKINKKVVVER